MIKKFVSFNDNNLKNCYIKKKEKSIIGTTLLNLILAHICIT